MSGSKPRILIIRWHLDNLNPTVRLWPLMFLGWADVTCFGPGHVGPEVLRAGVAQFLAARERFDVIVIDDHVLINSLPDSNLRLNARVYRQGYVCPFDIDEAIRLAPRMLREAERISAPLLISQFENDCYQLRQSHYDWLRSSRATVIGWGTELYPWKANTLDPWGNGANNRWKTFVSHYPERVISMPAMVADDEFCLTPLMGRPFQWSVPGTRYPARQAALERLGKAHLRIGGLWHYRRMKALSALGWPLYSTPAGIRRYSYGFQQTLRQSHVVFTCGSPLKLPIRKFFEIPAAGAVLSCDPPFGFQALGFVHGVNALVHRADDITFSLDKMQAIATAGQQLVRRAHSVAARAVQVETCVTRLLAGTFHGAHWDQGEMVYP